MTETEQTDADVIASIQVECPGASVQRFGELWQITLPCGQHAGAREDPSSLLVDLLRAKAAADLQAEAEVEAEAAEVKRKSDAALSAALNRAAKAKRDIEEANAVPEPEPTIEQPPASIADLFQTDRPFSPQAMALHELWVKLGHHIQRGTASPEDVRKHERLSGEIEFIKHHAFEALG